MIKPKLTTAMEHLKSETTEKWEKLKKQCSILKIRLKECYVFFCIYIPVSFAHFNMKGWIASERNQGTLEPDMFSIFLLLNGVNLLLLEYSLIRGLNLGKSTKILSFFMKLVAAFSIGHALLLYFGVVSL